MVAVRAATAADGPALRALDVATWSPAVSPAAPPDPGAAFFTEQTAPQDVLVAEHDGVLAGYVLLGRATPLASNAHVVQVQGLAVDPPRQRHGIARALLEAAVSEAARRDARRLTLRVLGSNTAAHALYAACGFEPEGIQREEFRIDGRFVDDHLLARTVQAQPG